MATAVDRGWPVRELSKADLYLVSTPSPTAAERAAGVLAVAGFPIRVRNEVGPLFRGLVGDLQQLRAKRGLPAILSAGGYNFRPIRGYEDEWKATRNPRYLSNHSWGFAVDLNVPTNPMGSPVRSDFPRAETYALAAKWGLSWGREWSRPDPQHFEFIGTAADARAAVARTTAKEDDDMTPEQDRRLANVEGILTRALDTKRRSRVEGSTWEGYATDFLESTNADVYLSNRATDARLTAIELTLKSIVEKLGN